MPEFELFAVALTADTDLVFGAAQGKQAQAGPVLLHALSYILGHYWWLALLIAGVFIVSAVKWVVAERRLARSGITDIDRMDGITFERRLAHLFTGLGYRVEQTRARGDYGADLVLEKNGERTVVQAKRWTKNVGVKAIQEAVAAKPMYRCSRALVVTNRYFTQQANRLAQANDVALWDRDDLLEALLRVADGAGEPLTAH